MLDESDPPASSLRRDPSPEIAALDQDIRTRFAKRTGSLDSFLGEWIKLDQSQMAFFNTRGTAKETYLQFCLAGGDLEMALAITRMCAVFARSSDPARAMMLLNHVDGNGNDVWHYLAESLAISEEEEGLAIARTLIELEIDFSRKNDKDESPLARLLIPEVKWQSLNTLLLAKTLTVEEMESSFSARINENLAVKAEVMSGIFISDLADNQAQLTRYFLQKALNSTTEKAERQTIARVMFEYAGGKRGESVLMKAIESDQPELFRALLDLLLRCAEEVALAESASGDRQRGAAAQQIFLYRRLGRRNRVFQSLLHKAVLADRADHIATIMGMMKNEPVVLAKRNPRGEIEREPIIVDKTSASPFNPAMSTLLHQDARGNLALHAAVLFGREECFRKLLVGLSVATVFALLTRVPNRYGLTVVDLISAQRTHAKLTAEVQAQRIAPADAQQLLQLVKKADKRMQELVFGMAKKAEEVLAKGGAGKPSFDLQRIPTIAMAQRQAAPPQAAAPAASARPSA